MHGSLNDRSNLETINNTKMKVILLYMNAPTG